MNYSMVATSRNITANVNRQKHDNDYQNSGARCFHTKHLIMPMRRGVAVILIYERLVHIG